MNQDIYDMQKLFALSLLNEGQQVAKFSNNDIWLNGELVCENGEVIQ